MISVLDVGSPQGILTAAHWRTVAASGVRGVFARCGNGNNAPDPTFVANRDGARAAGIAVGAYAVGFPLPDSVEHPGRDPQSQALAHFNACDGLGSAPGDLSPVLDLEWPMPVDWPTWGVTAASCRSWALAYLDTASLLWGGSPILYLYPDFAKYLFAGAAAGELEAFTRYRLWLARYKVAAPGTVAPWAAPTLWQKSDGGGRLPNGAHVDEDVFLGDEEAWRAFLGQAA